MIRSDANKGTNALILGKSKIFNFKKSPIRQIIMKHLFNFIENTKQPFTIEIGKLKIKNNSLNTNKFTYFEGVIYCKKVHFQPLLNLGVQIDFSNKKVGFAWNQNTIGAGSNNCAVNCKMDFETFKKVSVFFRKDYQLDILNDFQLQLRNFPFTQRKIKNI